MLLISVCVPEILTDPVPLPVIVAAPVTTNVPLSTDKTTHDRLVSLSATDKSLLPVKLIAVLTVVVTDVVAVELMAVPLNWLIGASLAPFTVTVNVVVCVAPLVSFTSYVKTSFTVCP